MGGFSSPGFGQGQSRTMDGQKHGLAGHDPITHFSCPRLPRRLCVCHPKRPTFSLTCILGAANQDASGAHPPCFPAAPSRHLNKSRVWIPSHVQDSKDRQREKKKIACMAVQLAKRSVDHRRLAIAGETGWPGVVCWPVHPPAACPKSLSPISISTAAGNALARHVLRRGIS